MSRRSWSSASRPELVLTTVMSLPSLAKFSARVAPTWPAPRIIIFMRRATYACPGPPASDALQQSTALSAADAEKVCALDQSGFYYRKRVSREPTIGPGEKNQKNHKARARAPI